ncbi:MAG: hypothetical protein OEU54_04490 [Gemmatimonadota bacterium]|nr:hypothetical protein [Gemmatimonadota bacterium]
MSDPRGPRFGRSIAELFVIFVGVSAAFFVENYREGRQELQELEQAVDGLVFELGHYSERTLVHASAIERALGDWQAEDALGRRAIPGDYTIPGALRPPAPAWETTVASGTANLLEPTIRMELGWFYNEFLGIHDNHARQVEFSEREILPRATLGPDAFYGADGRVLPQFAVHMSLLEDFGTGLQRMARWADSLRNVLLETGGR